MTRIEALLAERIGLDPASVGTHVIDAAIRACAGTLDLDTYADTLSDPRELERLIAAVVVPESSFFRDPASFDHLREWARRAPFLRVLSVPCAAGEEPYSIAATLLDAGLRHFTIDAVDIRADALRTTFRASAFRNEAARAMRERWFDGFTVRPELRRLVRFRTGNLLDPALLAGETFDVVFCKNLLIYFTAEARAKAVAQLQRLLAPGGLLFVGASEIGWVQGSGAFATRDASAMVLWSAATPVAAFDRGDASGRPASGVAAKESGSWRYRTPEVSADCWNDVGVWAAGGATCPRLAAVVHCHNCDVFARAGRGLLDQPAPPGYLESWAAELARSKDADAGARLSLFVFRIGEEWLALPATAVSEIAEALPVRRVPGRGANIVNVHGELHLGFSMSAILGIAADGGARRTIVIGDAAGQWVFAADEIWGLLSVDPAALDDVPVTIARDAKAHVRYIVAWERGKISCLDDQLLFTTLQSRARDA